MSEEASTPLLKTQVWGDGHTHSNWSDGFDYLQQNTELFRQYNQDFHVAADHVMIDVSRPAYKWEMDEQRRSIFRLNWDNLAAYQQEALASATPDHVVVDALELTWLNGEEGSFGAPDRAHVLVRDHIDRLPEAEFFRGRSLRQILLELKDREMRPFLAHIYSGIPYDAFDGSEFDGIELHYDLERLCHFDHQSGFTYWDHWLGQGHRLTLTGGSDCHQMDLWAASGARNVVTTPSVDREAIRNALLTGNGYVSATWHPDLYRQHGMPGNPGNTTKFTSWYWMLEPPKRFDREAVRPYLDTMIAATLEDDAGRAHRDQHPQVTLTVDDRSWGETADARDDAQIDIDVSMTVPVRSVRLIAQGNVIWREDPTGSETQLVRNITVSLRDCAYLRFEAEGSAGPGQNEYLWGNPIYLAR